MQHLSRTVGGFSLDVASGAADVVAVDKGYWVNVHGALMAVAWALLLPLGTFLPAHRWVEGSACCGRGGVEGGRGRLW